MPSESRLLELMRGKKSKIVLNSEARDVLPIVGDPGKYVGELGRLTCPLQTISIYNKRRNLVERTVSSSRKGIVIGTQA